MTVYSDPKDWELHWDNEFKDQRDDRSTGLNANGPGGAVYCTENGTVVFSYAYGKSSVANGVDFTVDQTPCGIRSVTKVMTAAMVLHAEQASQSADLPNTAWNSVGVIDRPISDFSVINNNIDRWKNKYLPEAARDPLATGAPTPGSYPFNKNKSNTNYPFSYPLSDTTDKVSLRMLASHQSGYYEIGKWADPDTFRWRPCYSPEVAIGIETLADPSDPFDRKLQFTDWTQEDNLAAYKNYNETLGSVDDIVAQAGAVLRGRPSTTPFNCNDPATFTANIATYTDKAGWLAAAICEELFEDSYYNLLQDQFDRLELENAYPAMYGQMWPAALNLGNNNYQWHFAFKGHHANGREIPGFAVPYSRIPTPDNTAKEIIVEPNQSMESFYAIGCAIMTAKDLNTWGQNILAKNSPWDGYLLPILLNELFTQQTNTGDLINDKKTFGSINWALGNAVMEPIQRITHAPGEYLECYGMLGQGGFHGHGGAMVWVQKPGSTGNFEAGLVFSAVTNTGISVGSVYQMAKDYVESFV